MAEEAVVFEHVTPEDYLEREKNSEIKHEYVDGIVYAMTGASIGHGRLAGAFAAVFDRGLPRKCDFFIADVKVVIKTRTTERYYYPDVVVTCEQADAKSYVCHEPLIIIEILSPSTMRIDRDEKFEKYRLIDSLEEYVLVHQDMARIEIYRRSNNWQREVFTDGDDFSLDAVKLDFSLEDLYKRVRFG